MCVVISQIFHQRLQEKSHTDLEDLIRTVSEVLMSDFAEDLFINVLKPTSEMAFAATVEVNEMEAQVCDGVPRCFDITVDKSRFDSFDELLRGIAHEMVHVKQMATGELAYKTSPLTGVTKAIWQGEEITLSNTPSKSEYFGYPWEVEAYGKEQALFHTWVDNRAIIEALMSVDNDKEEDWDKLISG